MKTFFTLLTIILFQFKLFSQANITCTNSGNWNNVNTWNSLSIPTVTDNVIIASGFTVTVNVNSSCGSMTLSNTGTLKSDSGTVLNVTGNWVNNGNYNSGKGTVAFAGYGPQTIGGSAVTSFYKLNIANSGGVSLTSNQSLKFLLTISQGIFTTNPYQFTLLSDSLTTASIGPISPGADISGKIKMQRYMNSSATGWRFLGSPVRTTLADWSDDFITSGFPGSTYPNFYWCSIYSYDETVPGTSDYGYLMPANVNDSIKKGVGYWAWVGPTPMLLEMTGVPVRFNHTFSVSLTPDSGKGEDGWNMIANPYPSAIDWDSPAWTKAGIEDAVYIWDPILEQYSTYVNGIGANGGSNIIPSSQAFWVEAGQTSPTLSCTEEVKTTTNKVYLKTNNLSSEKIPVKLTLEGNNFKDETVVCFTEGSSQNIVSNEDAAKLFSDNPLAPSISSIADTTEMVINCVPNNFSEIVIPIKVKVGVSGMYSITRNADLDLPVNACVYLEDLATGYFTDLRTSPVYLFNINDTTSTERFLLHMSKPINKTSVSTNCSYNNNGSAIVNYTSTGAWNSTWRDSANNIIAVHMNVNGADSLKNLAAGLYRVSISDFYGKCFSLSDSIIVSKPTAMAVTATVKDNQCKYESNGVINAQVNGGSAPYIYNWSNSGNTATIQNLLPGGYTLVAIDSKGCNDTSTYLVKTISILQANFVIQNDVTKLAIDEQITFDNQSVGQSSCLWDFGNGTTYVNDPSNVYATPGTYTITLTSNDGYCVSSIQKVINVNDKTKPGIANSEGVNIYNSDDDAVVQFDLKDPSESVITVYSIDGKLINTQNVSAYKNMAALHLGESHGIYLVMVETNGTLTTSKLIR